MSIVLGDGHLFVTDADDSILCDGGWKIEAEETDMAVRFLRGHKMRTIDALFDEISSACQFPYYFGENWAALAECLGDLSWMAARDFLLIVTKSEQLLVEEPLDRAAFGRALKSALDEQDGAGRRLRVVLQCEAAGLENMREVLNALELIPRRLIVL